MAYQGTFAIITAALDLRARSSSGCASAPTSPSSRSGASWSTPRSPTGSGAAASSATLGALDFAGGTVVHVNAAAAALVAALVLGQRKDYARQAILPHNVPFTLLGAGLLWFGWFGFNAGSALAANGIAALAFVNTMLAPAAHAGRLDAARSAPQPQGHRGRRRDRHRGRPGRDHSGGGLHRPHAGARARRARRASELLRPRLPRAHAARRLARRGRGARPRRHGRRAAHRRPRLEELERDRRRPSPRQPRPAGNPGARGGRGDRLQRRSRASSC